MNDEKKYFGMTGMQIGILGGLAALAMLLFCIIGVMLVRNGIRLSPPPASFTSTPQPTITPIFTPSPTVTPGPTSVPYEELIPEGWVQHKTALFEIWMSPGYTSANADVLMIGLGNSSIVDLSLRGTYSPKSPHKIYMMVSYEPLNAESLDALISQRLSELGPYLSLSERTKTDLNTVPAVRLMFSGRKGNNIDINELTYIILDGTTVWYVQYTAEITEFYEMLPTFESSAETFRVVR